MISELEALCSGDRMRERGLFSLERDGSGETLKPFQYLKGTYKRGGDTFFTQDNGEGL